MLELVKFMVTELVADKDGVEVTMGDDNTVTLRSTSPIWERLSVRTAE